MSGNRVSLETIRRVYDDDNGKYIEVGPDADSLGSVEIRTVGADNEEWWGKVVIAQLDQNSGEPLTLFPDEGGQRLTVSRLVLSKEFAMKLSEAIRRCAEEE